MTYDVSPADLQAQDVALVSDEVDVDRIPDFLGEAFGQVMAAAREQGVPVTGPPFARYRPSSSPIWRVSAGFPVERPIAETGTVRPGTLPAGLVAHTTHRGAYDELGRAHEAVSDWIVERGYQLTTEPWEVYLDDPDVPQPRTEVFMPCRPAVPGSAGSAGPAK